MEKISSIADLPNRPAVYALYGGKRRGQYVAYVGVAEMLKARIEQHLIRRDSSVTTGTSAVRLNPDLISDVYWWEQDEFADRSFLLAAELVAFDVLEPALRSRGAINRIAQEHYQDQDFYNRMKSLFSGPPSGILHILTLEDALEQIQTLEQRVARLEALVNRLTSSKT